MLDSMLDSVLAACQFIRFLLLKSYIKLFESKINSTSEISAAGEILFYGWNETGNLIG